MEIDNPLAATVARLQQKLSERDYDQALLAAEDLEAELESCPWDNSLGDQASYFTVQLFLYLIIRDLDNARFFWKRLDAGFKTEDSPITAAWAIGKLMWTRDTPQVYDAIRRQWSPEVEILAAQLQDRIQRDELDLVARAYRRITLESLAKRLGLGVQEAAAASAQRGWKVNVTEGTVELVAPPPPPNEGTGFPELERLTDYVKFLEEKSLTS